MQRLEAAESLQRGDSVPATARLQRALRGSGPGGVSPTRRRTETRAKGRPPPRSGAGQEVGRSTAGCGEGAGGPTPLEAHSSLSRLETEGDTGWRSQQCPGPALLRTAALGGRGRPAGGPWGQDQVLAVAEPARAFERRAQGLFRVGTAASFVLLTQQCYFYCRHFLTQDQSSTKNPARSPIST